MDSNVVFLNVQVITSVSLPSPVLLPASGMVFLGLFTKSKWSRN
jgi:hypothetical protein